MSAETELPPGWTLTTLPEVRDDRTEGIEPQKHADERFNLFSVPSHPTGCPESVLGKEVGSNKVIVSPDTFPLCKINPRINRVWVV